jgi:hypothetical protein
MRFFSVISLGLSLLGEVAGLQLSDGRKTIMELQKDVWRLEI